MPEGRGEGGRGGLVGAAAASHLEVDLRTIDERNNAREAVTAAQLQNFLASHCGRYAGALHGSRTCPHPNLPLLAKEASQVDCALP